MHDPSRGQDADFDAARAADAEADVGRLRAEWRLADAAVAGMSFGDTFEAGGEVFSLRMVYVHMIYEYARHNGQADLLTRWRWNRPGREHGRRKRGTEGGAAITRCSRLRWAAAVAACRNACPASWR
jgi:Protein of unknown function (DUF664)